jgi:hypothetical protein
VALAVAFLDGGALWWVAATCDGSYNPRKDRGVRRDRPIKEGTCGDGSHQGRGKAAAAASIPSHKGGHQHPTMITQGGGVQGAAGAWKKWTWKPRVEWGRDGGIDGLRRCGGGEKEEENGGGASGPVAKNGGRVGVRSLYGATRWKGRGAGRRPR